MSSRLMFGPRGDGWLALQVLLLIAIGLSPLAGSSWSGSERVASLIMGVTGMAAGLAIDIAGIRDLRSVLRETERGGAAPSLVQTGSYARIRHPIYAGQDLFALGWSLAWATVAGLVLTAALVLVLDLKARFEESRLTQGFPEYEAYQRRTRRFIPGVY